MPSFHDQAGCLSHITSSGAELTPQLVSQYFEAMDDAGPSLINLYGSSEVGADVTCTILDPSKWKESVPERVSIGSPIDNVFLALLDAEMNKVAEDASGEIWIGGDFALARGYSNSPDLTAERFLPDPFNEGKRLFRTGDVAKFLNSSEVTW
jgi:non-ribosomal peptide synthetase component F